MIKQGDNNKEIWLIATNSGIVGFLEKVHEVFF